MTEACTYCNSDIHAHDPVFVEIGTGSDREPAGQYCNYACLSAHIDDAGLADGASCVWEPGSS